MSIKKVVSYFCVLHEGYWNMVCPANSSYSFRATALILCRMFIHIMEVYMSTGFWFSSNILKMTGRSIKKVVSYFCVLHEGYYVIIWLIVRICMFIRDWNLIYSALFILKRKSMKNWGWVGGAVDINCTACICRSYSFGATALIFCRMFIHIMEVCMSTGFWFSHFWDRPVPIFSDVRFSYLALVQDKKNHVRFTGKCMLYSLCQQKQHIKMQLKPKHSPTCTLKTKL
jgi:hypothetical protein